MRLTKKIVVKKTIKAFHVAFPMLQIKQESTTGSEAVLMQTGRDISLRTTIVNFMVAPEVQ